ncbi:MAG: hypothetical protein U0354_07265 [Candidatus Sericytochromatia bacterium]
MVNIPSNLQGVWKEVAKDGKIDKSDIQKLLKEAAPSLSKDGKTVEKLKDELSVEESEFFDNFQSVINNNAVVDVKEGSANGTFEFVDQVKFPTPSKTDNKKYYDIITLGDNASTTTSQAPVTKDENKPVATTSGGVDPKDEAKLKELKELKETFKSNPQLASPEKIADLDKQIKELEDKIASAKPKEEGKTDNKPSTTETPTTTPTSTTNTTSKTTSEIKKDIDTLNALIKLRDAILKDPSLGSLETTEKKISDLMPKIKDAFINDVKGLTTRLASPDFVKDKDAIKTNYNLLPDSLKNDPEIKSSMDSIERVTAKQIVFAKINDVITLTVNEALKTGDMSKFTTAKNEVQRIIDSNPEIANDPEVQKIKAILSGAAPTESTGNNFVYRAIDTIKTTNSLLDKTNWTKADYAKAQELLNANNDPTSKDPNGEKFFIKGDFRTKLEDKLKLHEVGKAREKEEDKKTSLKGIEDVGGRGLFNAANKDGAIAIFQSLAAKNELEETIKRMKHDDQIRIMKMLAETGDKFNLSIAKKIYEIASTSSNIDDEIKPKLRDKIKEADSKELNKYPINQDNFYKGLQYSMYSEKEAAMTMIRDIIGGTVPSSILSKFNSEEIAIMTDLLSKNGHFGEKDEFLSLISGNYSKGDSVNIDMMSKTEKAQVIKGVLDNPNIDETKLDALIDKAGKKVVFDLVNNYELTNKQLVILAKHSDGDTMANQPKVASKMLLAMINENIKDPNSVSLADINKFIDEIDKDWTEDDDVMKLVLSQMGDGPDSIYAKFQKLAPATLDKIRHIAE